MAAGLVVEDSKIEWQVERVLYDIVRYGRMIGVQEWETKPVAERGGDLDVGPVPLCQRLESQAQAIKHTG